MMMNCLQAADEIELEDRCTGVPENQKSFYIAFEELSYTVKTSTFRRERRKLLNNIYGEFHPGELTAIMGPSGAGKSSLVDILTGFTTSSVDGRVIVNGRERDLPTFRANCAYIMQDDNLQPLLTVEESLHIAANLKLTVSPERKSERIEHILVAMKLDAARHTRTGLLSGGQKKRLAIALEIINNPPIMFFDEPTSGLDIVTAKQCLCLLKAVAREGRTVIITIHHPSARMFDMIDHLYVIADGNCVYTGGARNLVPFLGTLGLHCPKYYNPADFVMEICNGDYGNHMPKLKEAVQDGRSNRWRCPPSPDVDKVDRIVLNLASEDLNAPTVTLSPEGNKRKHKICSNQYATGFWKQLGILLKRNAIKLSRDKVLTFTRITMHILIALLVGNIYFQIGQDAAYAVDNFNLMFFCLMFLMYSAFSATAITFPSELPIVTREHFNRWYRLPSFYWANKLADFPVQILATLTFTLIVYLMSDQIPEISRFGLYILACSLVALVAQTFGLIIGTLMEIQNGVIFGPFIILPFMIFSGFFVHLNDAHPYLQWLFHASFLKYGFEAVLVAIYGNGRARLYCSQDYCHLAFPEKFLKTVDMKDASYWSSLVVLMGLYIALDITAYLSLRLKLRNRHLSLI